MNSAEDVVRYVSAGISHEDAEQIAIKAEQVLNGIDVVETDIDRGLGTVASVIATAIVAAAQTAYQMYSNRTTIAEIEFSVRAILDEHQKTTQSINQALADDIANRIIERLKVYTDY